MSLEKSHMCTAAYHKLYPGLSSSVAGAPKQVSLTQNFDFRKALARVFNIFFSVFKETVFLQWFPLIQSLCLCNEMRIPPISYLITF